MLTITMHTNSNRRQWNHKFPQTTMKTVRMVVNANDRCRQVELQCHNCSCLSISQPLCWHRCSGQTIEMRRTTQRQASERKRSKRASCIQRTRWSAVRPTCWNVWCSRTWHRARQTGSLICINNDNTKLCLDDDNNNNDECHIYNY